MKDDPRFLAGLRRARGVTRSSSQEGKELVHVDIDAVGEHTHAHTDTHTITAGGCATAAAFKERVQSGGKFPGRSPSIPKEPSYCCPPHPSVGQVARQCRPSCMCVFFF